MAILGQIRKRSFFLILVIGMALFAFVISGVFTSNGGFGSNKPIGEINGEEIDFEMFNSMVEQAQKLQNDRQSLVETLQKDAETLSNEDIAELQKDIQEKTADLEFILGKIQTKQNETVQAVATQLNPAMMQIINDLIVAKKIQLLLGADKALYFDGSVSITEQVTDALDGAASAEPESD